MIYSTFRFNLDGMNILGFLNPKLHLGWLKGCSRLPLLAPLLYEQERRGYLDSLLLETTKMRKVY